MDIHILISGSPGWWESHHWLDEWW